MKGSEASDTVDRSLIYNKNSKGPRIDPCGTPQVICSLFDVTELLVTNCSLCFSQLSNQSNAIPPIP